MCYIPIMKNKSFWKELKRRFVRGVGDFRDVRVVGEKNEWIRGQFAELSRLGNRPVVMMKMSS